MKYARSSISNKYLPITVFSSIWCTNIEPKKKFVIRTKSNIYYSSILYGRWIDVKKEFVYARGNIILKILPSCTHPRTLITQYLSIRAWQTNSEISYRVPFFFITQIQICQISRNNAKFWKVKIRQKGSRMAYKSSVHVTSIIWRDEEGRVISNFWRYFSILIDSCQRRVEKRETGGRHSRT